MDDGWMDDESCEKMNSSNYCLLEKLQEKIV